MMNKDELGKGEKRSQPDSGLDGTGQLPKKHKNNDGEITPAPPKKKKAGGSGRRKIEIKFIEKKSRRQVTFSRRKRGLMKKAYELTTLTGTQALVLIASETGHVYTFATPKLQPVVTLREGKELIQSCLNAHETAYNPSDYTRQQTPNQGIGKAPTSSPQGNGQSPAGTPGNMIHHAMSATMYSRLGPQSYSTGAAAMTNGSYAPAHVDFGGRTGQIAMNRNMNMHMPGSSSAQQNTSSMPIRQTISDSASHMQGGLPVPSDTSPLQMGTSQMGSSQMGSSQMGSSQMGSSQMGSSQMGNPQMVHLGTSQMGNSHMGSSQMGNSQMGNSQMGNSQMGNSQMGNSRMGNSQMGNSQMGNSQMGNSGHSQLPIQMHSQMEASPLPQNYASERPDSVKDGKDT